MEFLIFRSLCTGSTKDMVDVIFNGYNCSVFVYGATGAGKTHTMLGSSDNPGIIFRTGKKTVLTVKSVIKFRYSEKAIKLTHLF